MKKKSSLILDDEFILYCHLNKIENIDKLAKDVFNKGFTQLKYPDTPVSSTKERIVEKVVIKEVPVEKIVEVIKEVPVEKIVIKEVPVEKIVEIIKEVPVKVKGDKQIVTKEIIKEVKVEVPTIKEVIKEVINTEEIDKLKKENENLRNELDNINQSLEKFNKAKYMRNSDLGSLYSE
jgi:flagellar biosynthesis component FlhA